MASNESNSELNFYALGQNAVQRVAEELKKATEQLKRSADDIGVGYGEKAKRDYAKAIFEGLIKLEADVNKEFNLEEPEENKENTKRM